jgi:hypothetical protein
MAAWTAVPLEVPAGLPSQLLDRRPDVRSAEEVLASSTASIGAAKALLYPSIFLTGSYGWESSELDGLLKSPATSWSVGANILQPIFNAGQNTSRVEVAESQQRQALYSYERSVLLAFQEVEDSLVGLRQFGLVRESQGGRVDAELKGRTGRAALSRRRPRHLESPRAALVAPESGSPSAPAGLRAALQGARRRLAAAPEPEPEGEAEPAPRHEPAQEFFHARPELRVYLALGRLRSVRPLRGFRWRQHAADRGPLIGGFLDVPSRPRPSPWSSCCSCSRSWDEVGPKFAAR